MKVRSILLSIFALVFLCGPLSMYVAQHLHVDVSEVLQSESAKFLAGGWEKDEVAEHLSIEGFASGELQKAMDDKMGNLIPAKATALLTGAKIQRASIRISAGLLDMDCFPTSYGASVVYQAQQNALSAVPYKRSLALEKEMEGFGAGLADVANRFPDKTFCVVVADDSTTSAANPAHALSEDCFSTEEASRILQDSCSDADNVVFADSWYESAVEYYEHFYTTDHHWNGWGAIDAYERSLRAPEEVDGDTSRHASLLEPLEDLRRQEGLGWMDIHGSYARDSLMLVNELANEPELAMSSYDVVEGGPAAVLDRNAPVVMAEAGPIAEYDFYQTWYGQWVDSVVDNPQAVQNDREALIICDSYGTAYKWIASTGFGCVRTLYDLHINKDHAERLCDTLEKSDADVVFLVARPLSYQQVLNRVPDYFDVP